MAHDQRYRARDSCDMVSGAATRPVITLAVLANGALPRRHPDVVSGERVGIAKIDKAGVFKFVGDETHMHVAPDTVKPSAVAMPVKL